MYRLIVNTKYKQETPEWETVDLGKDVIASTYQVNDIAALKSREANRSNSISLPRTANNDRIFELPSEPASRTRYPYDYIDARLYDDGAELFGRGSVLKLLEANSDGYKVAIYASLFDFFGEMKNTALRDMDLGSVAWTPDAVANGSNNNDLISFPLIDWDAKEPSLAFSPGGEAVDPSIRVKSNYILPAISLPKLAERILKLSGEYKLKLPSLVANDDRYKNAVIPFSRMECSDADKAKTYGTTYGGTQSLGHTQRYQFIGKTGQFRSYHNGNNIYPAFTALADGVYVFEFDIDIKSNDYGWLNVEVNMDPADGNGWPTDVGTKGRTGRVTREETVEMHTGQTIWFAIYTHTVGNAPSLATVTYSAVLKLTKVNIVSPIFPSHSLPVAKNLPDITQADIFSLICQLWCLVPSLDERTKTLRLFSFDEVYANKSLAKDWSDKLDDRKHQTSFRWNTYAQKNTIKYKDEDGKELPNSERVKITSEGSFTIEDRTLERAKTLFELAFNTTEDTTIYGTPMAKIRAIPQGELKEMAEVKPKLLCTAEVVRRWGYVSDSIVTYKPSAQVATFAPMQMESFMPAYKTLSGGMLRRARLVVEMLNLTSLDLVNFDHSIPVHLSKYNRFFYVNKINNFTPGKLTEVELVALQEIQ